MGVKAGNREGAVRSVQGFECRRCMLCLYMLAWGAGMMVLSWCTVVHCTKYPWLQLCSIAGVRPGVWAVPHLHVAIYYASAAYRNVS